MQPFSNFKNKFERCKQRKHVVCRLYVNVHPPPPETYWNSRFFPVDGTSNINVTIYIYIYIYICRSQWPRGLRHELSSPAPTLGSWVRIPLRHGCLCRYYIEFELKLLIKSLIWIAWNWQNGLSSPTPNYIWIINKYIYTYYIIAK
jgi:hypothetical protein